MRKKQACTEFEICMPHILFAFIKQLGRKGQALRIVILVTAYIFHNISDMKIIMKQHLVFVLLHCFEMILKLSIRRILKPKSGCI